MSDVRKEYQLMDRCDAHVRSVQEVGGDVTVVWKLDSRQEGVKKY